MNVVVSPTGKHFHSSEACFRLYSSAKDFLTLDVDDLPVRALTPCKSCFPDAPRQGNYVRPYCPKCDSKKACRHNGGVLISQETTIKNHTHPAYASKVGRRVTNTKWVYPDSRLILAKRMQGMVQ